MGIDINMKWEGKSDFYESETETDYIGVSYLNVNGISLKSLFPWEWDVNYKIPFEFVHSDVLLDASLFPDHHMTEMCNKFCNLGKRLMAAGEKPEVWISHLSGLTWR